MNLIQSIKKIYQEKPGEDFIPKKDCLVTLVWHNIIGIPIIRLMQKLDIKISANFITFLSLVFAIIAGVFFFLNELIWGALFFAINMLFDSFDGKWARITNTTSEAGHKFDYYVDRITKIILYSTLWYSQYYLIGQWFIGAFIIFLHYLLEIIRLKFFVIDYRYKTIFKRAYSYYSPFEESYLAFFFGPLFGIVHILLPISILLSAISYTILLIKQELKSNIKIKT